ncbi:nitroreductase/quinone reductase family protein [Micromonospora sp. WMMD882]|uniref:nitroreductase/quinone reductase family protein n=1 Tax=Micromonospora sp. WMMD882 TaxID=3015151 RepID=UPI00248B5EEB|nr:nitroreductase/quinone reductase family protein [Micromonospora sp. WMMD882]WBB81424.1 nitroreductase/quinone reductase family protein [Micromonospora sp. WMMD882]
MPNHFNDAIIEEFRANDGRVGGPFEGGRLLLLTTTGVHTGRPHTTPLGYLPDSDDRLLVVASAGGADRHPHWYRNLVAQPRVTVEDGVFTYQAEATVLTGADRDRIFARIAEAQPGYAAYQAKTSRILPVVALRQVAGGPPNATSFGAALRLVHNAFRRELATVRREIAEAGPRVGAQLRINCLTVCQGLGFHHRAEDTGMFPALAARPELAPTLARLNAEHEAIAALLDTLQRAVADTGTTPAALLAEVDRLIAELENHLTYEEEQLIPALDAPRPG